MKLMIELTPDEHDAMLEVFNIAMGSAADTLSQMVEDEVTLSVPAFEFIDLEQLLQREQEHAGKMVCAVTQTISGAFDTQAMLMFQEDKAFRVVQAMLGEDLDEQIPVSEFSEIQQEAMTEIGNVVLNACMGSIANLFQSEFEVSLPNYRISTYQDLLQRSSQQSEIVLLLLIDFGLQRQEIEGHLAFLMDLPAMRELQQQVRILLENY